MSEVKLQGVEVDNPETPDEPEKPINQEHRTEIARKLLNGADPAEVDDDFEEDEEESEDEPDAKPEEKPAETVEEKPEVKEPETKAEVYTKEQVDALVQDSVQKAVNSIVAKERKREDNALKELRDIEIATGLSKDELKKQGLMRLKTDAMEKYAMSEEEAERYANEQQELRRIRLERDEAVKREKERELETRYVQERAAFLSDQNADAIEKEMVQRYAKEIDDFADAGKVVTFDVAAAYVIGKNAGKYWREREEKVRQATEQKTLKQVTEREKSKPEGGSGGKSDSLPALSATQREVARQMRPDLPAKEAEERYRKVLASQKKR